MLGTYYLQFQLWPQANVSVQQQCACAYSRLPLGSDCACVQNLICFRFAPAADTALANMPWLLALLPGTTSRLFIIEPRKAALLPSNVYGSYRGRFLPDHFSCWRHCCFTLKDNIDAHVAGEWPWFELVEVQNRCYKAELHGSWWLSRKRSSCPWPSSWAWPPPLFSFHWLSNPPEICEQARNQGIFWELLICYRRMRKDWHLLTIRRSNTCIFKMLWERLRAPVALARP